MQLLSRKVVQMKKHEMEVWIIVTEDGIPFDPRHSIRKKGNYVSTYTTEDSASRAADLMMRIWNASDLPVGVLRPMKAKVSW
jgi:hypothetical protein